jgi:hypothetical protein
MGERICWIEDLLIAFEHGLKIDLIVVFGHRFLEVVLQSKLADGRT